MTTETTKQQDPTISADGLWAWNGETWIPTGAAQASAPAAPPIQQKPKSQRGLIIGGSILAGLVLLVGAVAVAGSQAEPTSTDPIAQDQAAAQDEPASDNSVSSGAATSNEDTAQVGEAVQVGDWTVTVNEVNTNANSVIASANQFNEDPTGQYVMVTYTATYTGDETSADAFWDIYWDFAGSDSVLYSEASVVTPTDNADAPTEVRPGGTVTGQVVFDVPPTAIDGGSIIVETGYGAHTVEIYF